MKTWLLQKKMRTAGGTVPHPFQKILIPGTTSIWREVKVRGKYAYVTTEGGSNGLQIINLGKLPGTIAVSGMSNRRSRLEVRRGYQVPCRDRNWRNSDNACRVRAASVEAQLEID